MIGEEGDPAAICPICSREFRSMRGLNQHIRRGDAKHQEDYHQKQEVSRSKARWDQEEIYMVAKLELELIDKGCKSIVKELQRSFPHRSLDAIRSLRTKKEQYKQCIEELKVARTNKNANVELASEYMVKAGSNTCEERNLGSNGRTLFWENNTEPELELVNNWKMLTERNEEIIRKLIDQDIESWLPPKTKRCQAPSKCKQPCKINAKKKRKQEYASIQNLYRKNRGAAIRKILDGKWKNECTEGPSPKTLQRFWKNLFERHSGNDERQPNMKGPTIWELEAPITKREVDQAKKNQSKDSAPGLDNVTTKQLQAIPSMAIAKRFNAWLVSAYVPNRCRQGVTVLIPKVKGTMLPECHRPITMAPTILRLFHRILTARMMNNLPFSNRQKAFRKGDGIAQNLITIKSIIERSQKKLTSLSLAFLDVQKAFDSVNHSTIITACRRMGIPNMLLSYIRNLYQGSTTRLRIRNKLSPEILINRGIRQGDPLSVPLFLAVMDWVTSNLDPGIGVSMGEAKINHLAFADDLVILSTTDKGLQQQMDRIIEGLSQCGLNINPKKCATFRLRIDGSKKRWTINPEPFLKCQGTIIPSVTVSTFYKYLGIKIGIMSNTSFITENLNQNLDI